MLRLSGCFKSCSTSTKETILRVWECVQVREKNTLIGLICSKSGSCWWFSRLLIYSRVFRETRRIMCLAEIMNSAAAWKPAQNQSPERGAYKQKKRFFLHWAQTWRVHSHTLSNVYLLLSVAAHLFAREVLSFWRRLSRFTCLWFLSHLLCAAASAAASARSESNLLLLKFPLFSREKFALFIHQPRNLPREILSRRADIFSHIVD
jgi:hypothetical protein